jgi:hypothetical protein
MVLDEECTDYVLRVSLREIDQNDGHRHPSGSLLYRGDERTLRLVEALDRV